MIFEIFRLNFHHTGLITETMDKSLAANPRFTRKSARFVLKMNHPHLILPDSINTIDAIRKIPDLSRIERRIHFERPFW